MKNIVAALAMHESDQYVIEKAEELSRRTGAKITYVHAVTFRLFDTKTVDSDKLKADIQAQILKFAGVAESDIIVSVKAGWELIIDAADERHADIIVMGNQSKSHKVLYMGSTVKRVVEKIGVPVFIARGVPLDEKILIPTDLGEYTMRAQTVKEFLHSKAPATYVYADTSAFGEVATPYTTLAAYSVEYMQEEITKQIEDFKKTRQDADLEILSVDESVSEAIKDFAQKNSYTLTILASRNAAGLNPIIFGSTASKIAQIVDTNLLITFVEE
jgi:nucleotide-binding universal stress UspA family protein